MVSPVLAQVLRSGREHFNARFAAARRVSAGLPPDAFAGFLESAVDPVAVAVEAVAPARVADVVMVAYDLALELAAQRLAGGSERGAIIEEGWRSLLPGVPTLVAADPARMLGAVSNALHTLAATPGARPAQWIQLMRQFSSSSALDLDRWLRVGQVAAWRSGLAHFREPALDLADSLPSEIALALVGAPRGAAWSDVRTRLRASPWYDPADASSAAQRLRVAGTAGAFRGFGGLFPTPPAVEVHGQQFHVCCGDDRWVLTADAFGATFHRAQPGEHAAARPDPTLGGRLNVRGVRVEFEGWETMVPDLGEPTSAAALPATVALTSNTTHRVILLARPASS